MKRRTTETITYRCDICNTAKTLKHKNWRTCRQFFTLTMRLFAGLPVVIAFLSKALYNTKHLQKKIKINKSIQAPELRVIDAGGKNVGVLLRDDALTRAEEAGLDLIEISPNAKPPVAKIMDYGKYRYQEEKKTREAKKAHQVEVRGVQLGLNTSEHDLEMKAKKASEFLKDGDRVRVEIRLRGRAKYLDRTFLHGRLKRILAFMTEEYAVVVGPLKSPRGWYMLLERKK